MGAATFVSVALVCVCGELMCSGDVEGLRNDFNYVGQISLVVAEGILWRDAICHQKADSREKFSKKIKCEYADANNVKM